MLALSRDEVCRRFGFDDATLDALLAGGQLLCRLQGGEVRIPLEQLEAFFRQGLVNVYRAEAAGEEMPVALAAVALQPIPPPSAEEEPRDAPALLSSMEQLPDDDGPDAALDDEALDDEALDDDAPADQAPSAAGGDRPNTRLSQRYIPRRHLSGIFGDVKFTIMQMSATGLRVRHEQAVVPGDETKISFALLNPPRSFLMRGRIVWTSAARYESSAQSFYISGIKITEHVERLSAAIEILKSTHDLEPERRAVLEPRREEAPPVTAEETALVMKAVQYFAAEPAEAARWYGRARFALAEPQVRQTAPPHPRDREEVLGIWEYLDRSLEIRKIADILRGLRRRRRADSVHAGG
jgi:hypothetical protein